MKINKIFLFLFFLLIFYSCKKQSDDFINISITPSAQYEIMNSGDVIPFTIRLSSNTQLSEFYIVQIIDNSIIDTIFHSQISALERTEQYNYICPSYTSLDTTDVKLIFSCLNLNNDIVERVKIFSVISEFTYLVETTGHTMYSANSSKFDAYNLLDGLPMYSNNDSTSHILDNTDSISDILSREWVSMSNVLFTKVNQFNYPHATLEGIINAYNTNITKEYVDNIETDNIIIANIDDNYVLIKIIQVIDDLESENDKYIFSIKK